MPVTADAPSTPAAEIEIDAALVRSLLAEQQPALANEPIFIMESGWDNVMVRVGDEWAMRLPRRALAEPLLLNEQVWLPRLAPLLPVAIPEPVYCGVAQAGYPFAWSLQKWLPGNAADICPPGNFEAGVLAGFLKVLHRLPVPAGAPANPVRDCALSAKNADMVTRMKALSNEPVLTAGINDAWQIAVAEPADLKSCWVAGDIHARNVLTQAGKITAFIDWGDMCIGDPASDLASIWALFADPAARTHAICDYGMSDSLIIRAAGWAIFYGVLLAATGRHDTPRHYQMGCDTLARIDHDLRRELKPLFLA
jgi:aminoglycoside phosphotransferase (APT) family kinase protein